MPHTSYGLLTGIDLDELKRRIQVSPLAAVWERLQWRWRELEEMDLRGGPLPEHACLAWRSVTPMAMEAAFIFRMTGEEDALGFVGRRIRQLAEVYGQLDKPDSDQRPPVLSTGQIALATDMCRDGLAAEDYRTVCNLARSHLIDYHDVERDLLYYGAGRNIPVCRSVNAGIAALMLGEASGHPAWEKVVTLARDSCVSYLRRGLDSNGYPYEGTGYGLETLYYIYLYAQLLYQNGRDNLFESETNLKNVPLAAMNIMFPDRSALVNVNDLGLVFPWSMPWLLLTSRHYGREVDAGFWHEYQDFDHPQRPAGDITPWYQERFGQVTRGFEHMPSNLLTLLWWAPDVPIQPVEEAGLPTADHSRGTEMANFRTSWGPAATYLNVLGSGRSHTGAGHAHADCGHFSIFGRGEYLAVDTGRYNVDEDQHNVVLIDGKCHLPLPEGAWGFNQRSGRLHSFQRHSLLDYVVADSAHQKNCCWADRHVLFVRLGGDDGYIVTADNINRDHQKHSYWWQLHANPDCRIEVTGPQSAVVWGQHARLDVEFLFPGPDDIPDDPHRLELRTDEVYWAYGKKDEPGVEARETGLLVTCYRRPRLIAELTGLNGILMAIVVPRGLEEPPLAIRRENPRRILRAEIGSGNCRDTIVAALDHGYIRTDDIVGCAELALIRRDLSGKVLDSWTSDGEIAVS